MYNMTVFNAVHCERGAENHQVEGVPNNRVGVRCEHHIKCVHMLAQGEVDQLR